MAKINTESKTYQKIAPLADLLLTGKILAIDPSTGSQSSLPGFAYIENGKLIESGVIQVSLKENRSKKLYEIARTIREEFPVPDILIVEYIPFVTYEGGMNGNAIMALQKAIGAIMAAHPFEHMLEIPASMWKSYKPEGYEKSDEHDSICLWLCAQALAKHVKLDK